MNSILHKINNYIRKVSIISIIFGSIIINSYTNAWNLNVEDECVNGNCFAYNVSGNTYVKIPSNESNGVSISWGDEPGEELEKDRNYENISDCEDTTIEGINYKNCEKKYTDSENIHKVIIKDVEEVKTFHLENAHITEFKNTFGLKGLEYLYMSGNLLTDTKDYLYPPSPSYFKVIDLSYNKLTAFRGYGYSGTYIDLSNNQFVDIPTEIRVDHNSSIIELSDNTIYTGEDPEYTINLKNNPINFIKVIGPDNYSDHAYTDFNYERFAYSSNGYSQNFGYIFEADIENGVGNMEINETYKKDGKLIITGSATATGIEFTDVFSGYGIGYTDFTVYYTENKSISGHWAVGTKINGGVLSINCPNNRDVINSSTGYFARDWTGYYSTPYQFCYSLSGNNLYSTGCTTGKDVSISNIPNGKYNFKVWVAYYNEKHYTQSVEFSIKKPTELTHTLTINYVYEGGGNVEPPVTNSYASGESYSITSPEIKGYTPDIPVVSGIMGNEDRTITVTYTGGNTHTLTILYVNTGGESVFDPDEYQLPAGTKYTYPAHPKDNCTANPAIISGTMGNSDKFETVTYTCYTAPITYTVTFNTNGGSYIANQTVNNGSTVIRPTDPTKTNYKFAGWYSDSYFSNSYNFSSPVTQNITLHAKRTENSVTESSGGGTSGGGSSGGGSVASNLSLSISNNNPDANEWVKLNIDVNSKYTGKITFDKIQYYNTSTNKRTTISISSSYISDYCSELSKGYVKFSTSDYGTITISKFIKFSKAEKYRIYAEDDRGNDDYVEIIVDSDSSSSSSTKSNESGINISTNSSQTKVNEPIDITIKTNNYYTGKVKLYAKYRDETDSWVKISNESPQHLSDYSNIWEMGFYKITSSDKGKKVLSDLVEFKKAGDYRIYAEDERGYFNYVQVSIYSGNSLKTTQTDTQTHGSAQTLKDTSNEIYQARSCKEYQLQYDENLGAFTSPNLVKQEYFVNKDYLKRYIDSKNPRKTGCPTNGGWISVQYKDTSSSSREFVAPNGKIYYITSENGHYSSSNFKSQKNFSSLQEIKYYIRDHNPLIGMSS